MEINQTTALAKMDSAGKNILRRNRRRGHAVVEVALLAPWIFFLFVGAYDVGFCAHAALSVENSARVAALYLASDEALASDPYAAQKARDYVCRELRLLANVGTTCPVSVLQVSVPAQPFTGSDGDPAAQVAVTYTTVPLIPFPGLDFGGKASWTFTRVAQVRL